MDTAEITPAFSETVVAHIRDLATGEIAVMSGAKEVIIRDPQLVMRLVKSVL